MQHVSTCDSHHQADLSRLTFHRFYFVHVKRFLDQLDDDCHKSKHVALMLYFKCQLC